jgi:hypothetical protein
LLEDRVNRILSKELATGQLQVLQLFCCLAKLHKGVIRHLDYA